MVLKAGTVILKRAMVEMDMPEFVPVETPPAWYQAGVSNLPLNQETSSMLDDEPAWGIAFMGAHALERKMMS